MQKKHTKFSSVTVATLMPSLPAASGTTATATSNIENYPGALKIGPPKQY